MIHIGTKSTLRFLSKSHLFTSQLLQKNSRPAVLCNFQSFSTGKDDVKVEEPKKSVGIFEKLWGKESSVAAPTFKNRWAMVVPALMTHICIGNFHFH
jgi:hypothetical protein